MWIGIVTYNIDIHIYIYIHIHIHIYIYIHMNWYCCIYHIILSFTFITIYVFVWDTSIYKRYVMATAKLLVVGIVVQGNAFRLDPGHEQSVEPSGGIPWAPWQCGFGSWWTSRRLSSECSWGFDIKSSLVITRRTMITCRWNYMCMYYVRRYVCMHVGRQAGR